MTAQYSASLNPAGFVTAGADVSGDGLININDALLIARYSAGIITKFPVSTVSPTPTPTITPVSDCYCTRTVSGTVTNQAGVPLANANVYAIPLGYCGNSGAGQVILTPTNDPAYTPVPLPTITPASELCIRSVLGNVKNINTNQVIAGAQIYENGTLVTTTNTGGNFFYTRPDIRSDGTGTCPVGEAAITVKANGYQDFTTRIPINNCGSVAIYAVLNPLAP